VTLGAPTLRPRTWLAGLFVVSLLISLSGNGAQRPIDAHEAFVARTATEMSRRGEWAVPWFNDEIRLQKPPLSYWLAMGVHAAAGGARNETVREWEARLPSVVAGALLAVVTALLGWVTLGSLTLGLFAAAMLATTQGFVVWSHSAQPEMLYACFCGVELFGFALAAHRIDQPDSGRSALRAAAFAWIGFALAVLTKGPLLPVFILVGAILGLALSRPRPRIARVVQPWIGLAILAVIVVPYFAWVAMHLEGAVELWRSQMFSRTGGVSEAWWRPLEMYYVVRALKVLLPWSALLPAAVLYLRLRRGRATPTERLVFFAAVVAPIALSFSEGRKSYYLLPVLPPLCVLMAGAAAELARRWRESEETQRRIGRVLRAHAVLGGLGVVAAGVLLSRRWDVTPLSATALVATCAALALALAFCVIAWRHGAARSAHERSAAYLLAAAACGGVAIGQSGLGWSVSRFTGGAFAREVGQALPRDRDLAEVDGDIQVLIYYADRPVRNVERDGLPAALAAPVRALFVDTESSLAQYGANSRVLVRERVPAHEDAMVLIESAGEPRKAPL
jgi:4-amino-4-deoxy-L-arabinose transferase-like glycosyltransferase